MDGGMDGWTGTWGFWREGGLYACRLLSERRGGTFNEAGFLLLFLTFLLLGEGFFWFCYWLVFDGLMRGVMGDFEVLLGVWMRKMEWERKRGGGGNWG